MGIVISKILEKVSEYKREREKRKIMKIYSRVFQDDDEIYRPGRSHMSHIAEI